MPSKPKTREEVLAKIKKTMADRRTKTPVYDDWHYGLVEVDVCDIDLGDEVCRVPAYIGKIVLTILEDPNKKNEMITLGDLSIRAYKIQRVKFRRDRFISLDEWGKRLLLEKEPELFGKWEERFSPELRNRIEKLKTEPVKRLEANFEGI